MIRKVIFSLLAGVILSAAATASPKRKPPTVLTLGMRGYDVEKVFGEAWKRSTSRRADVGEIHTYFPRMIEHAVVDVSVDRDGEVVRFVFDYMRRDNGGNDPTTGRPWMISTTFVNSALKLFPYDWKQVSSRELTAERGKVVARIVENSLVVELK